MVYRKYTRKKGIQDGGASPPKTKEKAKNFAAKPILYHERSKLSRFFRRPFTSKQQRVKNEIAGKTGFSGNNLTRFLNITSQKANAKELALLQKQRTWLGLRKYTDAQRKANITQLKKKTVARQTAELAKVIGLASARATKDRIITDPIALSKLHQQALAADALAFLAARDAADPTAAAPTKQDVDILRKGAFSIQKQLIDAQATKNTQEAQKVNDAKNTFQKVLENAQQKREKYATTTVELEKAKRKLREATTIEDANAARTEVSRLETEKAQDKAKVNSVKPKTFFQRAFSKSTPQNLRQKYNDLQRAQNIFSKTTLAGRQQRLNNVVAGRDKPKTVKAKGIISGSIDEQLRKAQKVAAQKGLTSTTELQELQKKKIAKQLALNKQLPSSSVRNVAQNQAKRETAAADSLITYLKGRDPVDLEKFSNVVKDLSNANKERFEEYKTKKAEQLKTTKAEIERVIKEKEELNAQLAQNTTELANITEVYKNVSANLTDSISRIDKEIITLQNDPQNQKKIAALTAQKLELNKQMGDATIEEANKRLTLNNKITQLGLAIASSDSRMIALDGDKKKYENELQRLEIVLPPKVVAPVLPSVQKLAEEFKNKASLKQTNQDIIITKAEIDTTKTALQTLQNKKDTETKEFEKAKAAYKRAGIAFNDTVPDYTAMKKNLEGLDKDINEQQEKLNQLNLKRATVITQRTNLQAVLGIKQSNENIEEEIQIAREREMESLNPEQKAAKLIQYKEENKLREAQKKEKARLAALKPNELVADMEKEKQTTRNKADASAKNFFSKLGDVSNSNQNAIRQTFYDYYMSKQEQNEVRTEKYKQKLEEQIQMLKDKQKEKQKAKKTALNLVLANMGPDVDPATKQELKNKIDELVDKPNDPNLQKLFKQKLRQIEQNHKEKQKANQKAKSEAQLKAIRTEVAKRLVYVHGLNTREAQILKNLMDASNILQIREIRQNPINAINYYNLHKEPPPLPMNPKMAKRFRNLSLT
jgi:hypothetical protein